MARFLRAQLSELGEKEESSGTEKVALAGERQGQSESYGGFPAPLAHSQPLAGVALPLLLSRQAMGESFHAVQDKTPDKRTIPRVRESSRPAYGCCPSNSALALEYTRREFGALLAPLLSKRFGKRMGLRIQDH